MFEKKNRMSSLPDISWVCPVHVCIVIIIPCLFGRLRLPCQYREDHIYLARQSAEKVFIVEETVFSTVTPKEWSLTQPHAL